MASYLSVLVCTHNPKEHFLRRALQGLSRQSLPLDRWELLLIDNRSSAPVRERYDLSWHPNGRHLTAETLGKTHAIAEGVRAAKGDVLIVVDDDNVLRDDYLETAERLFREHPFVGAAGGIVDGEYESPPPAWITPYLPYLAVANHGEQTCYAFTPDTMLVCAGAGMVIRKPVVEHYLQLIANDPVRQSFDPVGDKLSRCGDSDMMMCAYDVGLAKGYFPALRLTHLIPAGRLRLDYMTRLRNEGDYCDALMRLIRGQRLPGVWFSFLRKCRDAARASLQARTIFWQRFWVEWAALRGQQRGRQTFATLRPTTAAPEQAAEK